MTDVPAPSLRALCDCTCQTHSLSGISRRRLLMGALSGLALAGCKSAVPLDAPLQIDVSPSAGRIDVHHHASPPAWLRTVQNRGIVGAALHWSAEKSLADMDRAGIQTAILSITPPGVVFADLDVDANRRLARECNEWQAQLAVDYPGRFGFFAALPMGDTAGSLEEIAYSLDVLKANGIGLLTSYGDKWLGDPSFLPVMEELNRRRAVVYTHPTSASCCTSLQNVPATMIEYGTDTTRTIASILFSGNAQRFRDIRWIFSHAGGTMPFLIERFERNPIIMPTTAHMFPQGVRAALQQFYYDTAQSSNVAAMSALTEVVPTSQVLFGTDFPYRNALEQLRGLRKTGLFDASALTLIERRNALELLGQART